ncbi:cysteine--tRNA ligase [bacterium]|nr:cysteine--tRNA ligase [bacterium]
MALPKITLFNTLTNKKETLETIQEGMVNIYACGPTVYNYTHVGNARASITPDFVVRVLKSAGYKVKYLSNITDVDDKIIKAANDEGCDPGELAKRFEAAFIKEMHQVGNNEPDGRPRATEHISEMVAMIEKLIAKDYAYAADTPFGKDVYFRVTKFEGYGKLSKRHLDDMIAGARIEPGETKQNPLDFAMWKSAKPGEPSWSSPWGEGRPGWHIECSAMVDKHFPNGIDIHMGGLDLIFPHHENEIAQSESCNEHAFAKYWVHNGMLTVEREKMSKSLGNFFLTKDFFEKFGAETLRLLFLQQHYRSPIDFSEESILRTEAMLERIYNAKQTLQSKGEPGDSEACSLCSQIKEAVYDDFNSAKALGFFLKSLRIAFKENTDAAWKEWGRGLSLLNSIFGIANAEPQTALEGIKQRRFARSGKNSSYCESVDKRLIERQQLREARDFDAADQIRKDLESEGVLIMDGPDGTAWQLKAGS